MLSFRTQAMNSEIESWLTVLVIAQSTAHTKRSKQSKTNMSKYLHYIYLKQTNIFRYVLRNAQVRYAVSRILEPMDPGHLTRIPASVGCGDEQGDLVHSAGQHHEVSVNTLTAPDSQ